MPTKIFLNVKLPTENCKVAAKDGTLQAKYICRNEQTVLSKGRYSASPVQAEYSDWYRIRFCIVVVIVTYYQLYFGYFWLYWCSNNVHKWDFLNCYIWGIISVRTLKGN